MQVTPSTKDPGSGVVGSGSLWTSGSSVEGRQAFGRGSFSHFFPTAESDSTVWAPRQDRCSRPTMAQPLLHGFSATLGDRLPQPDRSPRSQAFFCSASDGRVESRLRGGSGSARSSSVGKPLQKRIVQQLARDWRVHFAGPGNPAFMSVN